VIAGSGKSLEVLEVALSTSVETDALEEQIELELVRYTGTYTSGSGGTTATGLARGILGTNLDAATINYGSTTQAVVGTGTKEVHGYTFMNNRLGLQIIEFPRGELVVNTTDAFVIAMLGAATNTFAVSGWVKYLEQIG
jgi:hypothetical protein